MILALLILPWTGTAALAAEANQPACDALEAWAATVDARDRYTPIPGNRTWAPQAFGAPAFAAVFGKPALDLSQDEVNTLGDRMKECQKAATRERRYDAQKALNAARGLFVGRMTRILAATAGMAKAQAADQAAERAQRERAVARQQARQRQGEGAVRNFLAKLLGQPDSPELLRDLVLLRRPQAPDPNQLTTPFARNFTDYVSQWGKSPNDPDIAAEIDGRIDTLRDPLLADVEHRMDAVPSSGKGLGTLKQVLAQAFDRIGPALRPDDRTRLKGHYAARRTAMQADVTGFARENIAKLPATPDGLVTVQRWRREILRMDVTAAQRQDIIRVAEARQTAIADRLLAKATAALEAVPETLDGIARLDRVAKTVRSARAVASEPARAAFATALDRRQAEVREGALPEFRARMASLPEDRDGLNQARDWVAQTKAALPDAPVRTQYVEAAIARRDAIQAALDARDRDRRQAALAAGGDPRLVGLAFVEGIAGMRLEFRDERRVFMNFLGVRAMGDYEVSRDDVIVNGPHGQMVLTIQGDTLSGQGLTFARQE
ncbi:MAG: hypothetical protein KDC18_18840 [Alphaproteobacteria bacterium]|nr:hypothetical protein [Alphaproteobacteria bacterium]MCB9929615.1 hypothetical protein [Alphaproteobacteria bacterium]